MSLPTAQALLETATANADFETQGDLTKARAYLVACNQLAIISPSMSGQGARHQIQIDTRKFEREALRTRVWISRFAGCADGAARPKLPDFRNLRGYC